MQFRGLLAAVGILAALSVGIWVSNRQKAKEDKKGSTSADTPQMVAIAEDQIQQIDLKRKDGSVTTLKKTDKWQITAPQSYGVDQDTVNSMLSTLSSLNADRVVEDKPGDVTPFGLAQPQLEVAVLKKDGKTTKLQIGDSNATDTGYYARLDGDPKVYLIGSSNRTNLDKSVTDLRDKRLIAFDSDKLTRVELNAKGQTIEVGKNQQNEWQIVRPKPLRADNWGVEELVRKLKEAKMDATASEDDTKKAAAAFASGTPVATAKATDAGGTHSIEVRKKDNNYYAKGSAIAGVFKVSNDLGEGLNKGLDDFRNKKLFDFGFNDPSRVEVKSAAGTKVYQKSGEKWMSDGKEMDAVSVQSFIDKLRDLSAIKFLDSGYTAPVFEVTVTAKDGKLKDHVLISKTGNSYFAIRENEPAVYELDGKAVEEMQRTAGDIKPPAPPAKDEKKKK